MLDVVKEIKVNNSIVANELCSCSIFNKIFNFTIKLSRSELLLSIFANPKINLLVQMVNLAQLSFMLLIIYRRNGSSFITNDLYSDIQSTIQDAFVAASHFRVKRSENDFLIYQLGTDPLEMRFCTVRTLTHSNNCNFQELLDRLQTAESIENIYERYPNMSFKDRLSTRKTRAKTEDYSSIRDWTGNWKYVRILSFKYF